MQHDVPEVVDYRANEIRDQWSLQVKSLEAMLNWLEIKRCRLNLSNSFEQQHMECRAIGTSYYQGLRRLHFVRFVLRRLEVYGVTRKLYEGTVSTGILCITVFTYVAIVVHVYL